MIELGATDLESGLKIANIRQHAKIIKYLTEYRDTHA